MDNKANALKSLFLETRATSESLCEGLEPDDLNLQVVPETSPLKWHLAHTSWFFETFILQPFNTSYRVWHEAYEYLFNSYYNSVGAQFPRPQRHILSRPSVSEVLAYRQHINEQIVAFLEDVPEAISCEVFRRLELGVHHEQQHQELMMTDLKYNWSLNPLSPVYSESPLPEETHQLQLQFQEFNEGIHSIGLDRTSEENAIFAFDNESPRHRVWLDSFAVANRLTTNAEYIEFIEDGGYQDPQWWVSDGWSVVQQNNWKAPLYWHLQGNDYSYFTLHGKRPVSMNSPVCHVSLYEAMAYANWKGMRICTEQEWEVAASLNSEAEIKRGNFQNRAVVHPLAASTKTSRISQLFGDVWEWTQSAYSPYPGYRSEQGALGEYNGKFMMNQCVLRGGSVATPKSHIRPTYRNFFYPQDRWQFSGIRLAYYL